VTHGLGLLDPWGHGLADYLNPARFPREGSPAVYQFWSIIGVHMSGVNGDKARFNRVRKQKLARRVRNRELVKNAGAQAKPAISRSEKKPVEA